MNKKSGFTLAEVLVTLMIIGVIASMTVPSLMQNTAQQEYKAALKKAVSTLNQAVAMNYALDGEDASAYTGTSFVTLMKKRMNVAEAGSNYVYTADGIYYQAGTGGNCSFNSEDTDGTETACVTMTVDVNGRKGPNKYTASTDKVYDIYTLNVYPQKVLPKDSVTQKVLFMK